jgi:hypothetical protein
MYQFYLSIFVILFSLFLALFVISRNAKSINNILFFLLSVSSNIWLLFSTLADHAKTIENALLFARLAMLGAPIAFAFTCAFSMVFPRNINFFKKKLLLILLPVIPVYFFIFSNYNVQSVKFESWGTDYTPGILYYYVLPLVVVYSLVSFILLIKKYKVAKGIAKAQIKYVIFSLCLSALFGFITNGILPVLFNFSQLSVLGPSFTILAINGIIAYSIVRYRF